MKPRRLLATLMVAGMLGVATLAACTSDSGSSTNGSGDANLAAGTLAGQVESLTRALSAGGLDALPQALSGQQTGISVTGRGEVTVTPDLALLRLGVEARGDTVALARADAADALTAMVDVLSASGLQESDIQTRFFNIRPEYTSVEVMSCVTESVAPSVEPRLAPSPEVQSAVASAPPPPIVSPVIVIPEEAVITSVEKCFPTRERVIVGYTVTNQITAKIRDLDGSGELIDRVADAGGDLVRSEGISFTVEEPTALQNEARELAIKDLVARAQQMAEIAGVELGRLVRLSESGGGHPPRIQADFARAEFAMAAPAAATPISLGELTVTASVQGVFAIRNSVEE